ncbi:MAG: GGDEF domain-containing protein [Bacilli bacterium]|nr:GGDEF domain-containing protein [Bacilli bacterium]
MNLDNEKTLNNDIIDDKSFFEDEQTTLYNKNYFVKHIVNIALQMIDGIYENKINGNDAKTWSILYCDIDGLKLANDTLGHFETDHGIKYIADIIKNSIRTNRKQNDSIIYPGYLKGNIKNIPIRIGGDEFIIILPNCTKEKALLVKNRIKKQLKNNPEQTRNMSLSIGIADTSEALIPIDLANKEQTKAFVNNLVSLAEKRMYEDKNRDINSMSLEERKAIILKHLNRVAGYISLNINKPDDIDIFIDILTAIKESKTNK